MKKKNLFVALGLAVCTLFSVQTASAQVGDTSSKNHYYEQKFGDNMYMSLGAGFNLYMIQDIEGVKDDRPLTAAGSFASGK